MFGLTGKKDNSNASQMSSANDAIIFDVTAADFEQRVIAASMEKPVIVDFWAPWCGPCKQMMPTLEQAVSAAGGEVLLAKVNLDENPELAGALRVQSVPAVFAFIGGRPVDAFQGAQPASQIQAFIDNLVQAARGNKPGAIDIPEGLKSAAEALAAKDLQTAQGIYAQILQQDEKNTPAYVGLVRTFIAAGTIEHAEEMIANAPEDIAKDPDFIAAKTALEMAQKAAGIDIKALQKAAAQNPDDHQIQIDLAEGLFALDQKQEAMDVLLPCIAQDRAQNEEAARKALLKFFEAMGHSDPLTIDGRKKLSRILFS